MRGAHDELGAQREQRRTTRTSAAGARRALAAPRRARRTRAGVPGSRRTLLARPPPAPDNDKARADTSSGPGLPFSRPQQRVAAAPFTTRDASTAHSGGRSSGSRIVLRPRLPASALAVASRSLRPRSQRRVRAGLAPASLGGPRGRLQAPRMLDDARRPGQVPRARGAASSAAREYHDAGRRRRRLRDDAEQGSTVEGRGARSRDEKRREAGTARRRRAAGEPPAGRGAPSRSSPSSSSSTCSSRGCSGSSRSPSPTSSSASTRWRRWPRCSPPAPGWRPSHSPSSRWV